MISRLTSNIFAVAAVALALGALWLGGWAFALKGQNETLRADLKQAEASREAQADVSAILGGALVQTRVRARQYADDLEELSNVYDPETCRSPAIDAAFDLVRRNRGARGD